MHPTVSSFTVNKFTQFIGTKNTFYVVTLRCAFSKENEIKLTLHQITKLEWLVHTFVRDHSCLRCEYCLLASCYMLFQVTLWLYQVRLWHVPGVTMNTPGDRYYGLSQVSLSQLQLYQPGTGRHRHSNITLHVVQVNTGDWTHLLLSLVFLYWWLKVLLLYAASVWPTGNRHHILWYLRQHTTSHAINRDIAHTVSAFQKSSTVSLNFQPSIEGH